ncbi:hypothetical protein DFH08DRAFT_804397 [Mycena albidolilacea]|uniref:Uncharacterized protein n=1 Tax=Mycena albidolilacea TaxID=1033008 RepID=A0AAD7AC06_9AGAR|nr:hypothetical protein DFH08DRAFT_804397 [Mycena albidolilacea]
MAVTRSLQLPFIQQIQGQDHFGGATTLCRSIPSQQFAKELDRGVDGAELTKWKQETGTTVSPAINRQARQFTPSPIVDDTATKIWIMTTGPLDTGHERKIVDPELSESSVWFISISPAQQLEHSTPGAALTFVFPTADPSLAPKGCERTTQVYTHHDPVDQVKLRCKVKEKVSYIPRVWHKSELILFAVDLGGVWLIQTAMKLWRSDYRCDLFTSLEYLASISLWAKPFT